MLPPGGYQLVGLHSTPEEVECLLCCAEHGFAPDPDTLQRLIVLRQRVDAGQYDEWPMQTLEVKRIQFARFLVLTGRISETIPDSD